MKDTVLVVDDDRSYSKKFCNKANTIVGQKYNFVSFANISAIKDFLKENTAKSVVIPESCIDKADDINVSSICILNENYKDTKREGKKVFIYKLQNINAILDVVDKTICGNNNRKRVEEDDYSRLVLFYTPFNLKNKSAIIKKIAKIVSLKNKVLVIDIDEFNNYKGSVGLSNIIFNYKEKKLTLENLRKEIVNEDDFDQIKSITYPEDFNIITNIDLANIVNEVRKLGYDYIFIDADPSFVKCQYILNDSDKLIICKEKEEPRIDIFEKYLKSEKLIDYKKITELDISKGNKTYLSTFIKQGLKSRNDRD